MISIENDKSQAFWADFICQDKVVAHPENLVWVFRRYHEMGKQAQFLTVHKSKGLEKEAVLIVNVIEDKEEDYTIPARDKDHPVVRIIKTNGLQDAVLAEEERLFYVALSRAEKHLFIVTEEKRESVFIKKIRENQKNLEVIILKSPMALTKADKE